VILSAIFAVCPSPVPNTVRIVATHVVTSTSVKYYMYVLVDNRPFTDGLG
jgi:hypothetical protein